jgi:(p)ppGpp synthase/HD superfamily hydrolase
MENKEFLSKYELELLLGNRINAFELNQVISAYEMAEEAHQNIFSNDGKPSFYHVTRVCNIIISELNLIEPDIITAALLHDIFITTDKISEEIIDYNFGAYVTLLLHTFNEDYQGEQVNPEEISFELEDSIKVPGDDFMILKLSEILDEYRSLEFSPAYSPVRYILNSTKKYLSLLENSENPHLQYLVNEIKKVRNKILG